MGFGSTKGLDVRPDYGRTILNGGGSLCKAGYRAPGAQISNPNRETHGPHYGALSWTHSIPPAARAARLPFSAV